jgi:hypothetical protein
MTFGPVAQVAELVSQLLAKESGRRQRFSAITQAGGAAAAGGLGSSGGRIMSRYAMCLLLATCADVRKGTSGRTSSLLDS